MEDLHLSSISEQVKSLNIVSYAEAPLSSVSASAKREGRTAVARTTSRTQLSPATSLTCHRRSFENPFRRDVDDCLSLCNWSMLTSLVYNDKEMAKGLLLSALRANHRHHRSWYYLAQLFAHDLKEPRVADWLYRTALQLNPSHVNSHKDYGNLLLFAHKDSVKAEVHYRTAVALQPNHVKALIALGGCLARKAKVWKDFDGVMECWRKAANSNYADHRTRRTTQQTFVSMLTIKGQLHADRREVDKARQCFEEAIAFRSPALLPYQIQQSTQVGLHFPPAAALAVYAQFERLQGRLKRAEGFFLQAIAIQTQLRVDVEANCLILPNQPSPLPSSTISSALLSATSTPPLVSGSLSAPSHSSAPSHVKPAFVRVAPLPSTSVWAMGGHSLSSSGATTPSSAGAGSTESGIRVQQELQPPAVSILPLMKSPPLSSPHSVTVVSFATPPSATAVSSPPMEVVEAPAPPPTPLTVASSFRPTAVNVWKQQRQWLPDSTPHTALPSVNQLRAGTSGRRSSGKSETSASPAVLAGPSLPSNSSAPEAGSPRPPRTSAAPQLPGEHPQSNGEEMRGEKGFEAVGDAALKEGPTADDVEAFSESPFPPSEVDDEDGEDEVSRDLRQLTGAISPTPDAVPPHVAPSGRRFSMTQYQAEVAERAEEERREKACVDTSIIRLYADHLHRYRHDDPDSAERWYRTALSLCSFGRSGSLNLASYADFLGRRLHLQFEAQRVFQRSISSPCPAPEALLKYAAYLRDVILDRGMAERLTEQAETLRKTAHVGHRCHRTRAGWYCDGYCDLRVVKPMLDAAKHWGKARPERPSAPSASAEGTSTHRPGGPGPPAIVVAQQAPGGRGGAAFVPGHPSAPPPTLHSPGAIPSLTVAATGSAAVSPPFPPSVSSAKSPTVSASSVSPLSVTVTVSPRAAGPVIIAPLSSFLCQVLVPGRFIRAASSGSSHFLQSAHLLVRCV